MSKLDAKYLHPSSSGIELVKLAKYFKKVKQQEDDKRRRSEAMRDISNRRHPPRRRRDKVALSVNKELFRLPLRNNFFKFLFIQKT
jgi:ribosomal protein L18E